MSAVFLFFWNFFTGRSRRSCYMYVTRTYGQAFRTSPSDAARSYGTATQVLQSLTLNGGKQRLIRFVAYFQSDEVV